MMEKSEMKIGFIGFGNMAQAICDGMILKKSISPENIYACAKHYDKLKENAAVRQINACKNAPELVEKCDMIILAVKPYLIEEIVASIKEQLKQHIVVSVAAGWNYEKFIKIFNNHTAFISTIPNTPVCVGEGVIVAENKHTLNQEQLNIFENVFSPIALIEYVESHQLSIAGTISGCGPAFASLFLEALADAGVKYGLSRQQSYHLASQMVLGTGKMQLVTQKHPGVLKDEVCSPSGTTIKGVTKLEECGLRSALVKAIDEIEG